MEGDDAYKKRKAAEKRRRREKNPEKVRAADKRQYWKDVEKSRAHNREDAKKYRGKCREEALNHYGHKCVCCGESRTEFLAIDHIYGGGLKHRRENHVCDISVWLKQNNYPLGFRLLCHNCNMARGLYGYCPHEREAIVHAV